MPLSPAQARSERGYFCVRLFHDCELGQEWLGRGLSGSGGADLPLSGRLWGSMRASTSGAEVFSSMGQTVLANFLVRLIPDGRAPDT
jgi:hypothetical protein